jgi:Holliday junction resolvasome RuvABC ATP-dependent DNA helicase subunit
MRSIVCKKTIEEYLYPAMEDFKLDIIIDQGPNARSVRLNLPRLHAHRRDDAQRIAHLAPLLTRFPVRERLDYYDAEQLHKIVVRSARLPEHRDRGQRRDPDCATQPRHAAHREQFASSRA